MGNQANRFFFKALANLGGALVAALVLATCVTQKGDKQTKNETGQVKQAGIPTFDPDARSLTVQLFDYPFKKIEDSLCDLAELGFSHVHVSPPNQTIDAPDWWGRYQPDDPRRVGNPLGSEAEFDSMMAKAQECGMVIVVDLVLNHMANYGLPYQELYYPKGCNRELPYAFDNPSACVYRPENFHQPECIQDYGNLCAVMYGRICGGGGDPGLPDLKTGNCDMGYDPHVLQVAKDAVNMYLEKGVRGFRLDAAKHMKPVFIRDLLAAMPSDVWV